MKFTLSTIALCAMGLDGAFALPSAHQHNHHHQHARSIEEKDVNVNKRVDFNDKSLYKDVDWSKVFDKGGASSAPAPAPAANTGASPAPAAGTTATPAKGSSAPASAAPASSASSSGGSDGSDGGFLSDIFGGISKAVSNGNVDEYIGNVGIPYGSNIKKVANADADKYKYTNTFNNAGKSETNVIVWNKSGPNGQANSGQFSEPALSFKLAAGASQVVAFDENSQVAFCEDAGKKTQYGANDCTYGEADFGDQANKGWSGFDVSSIQNGAGNTSPISITSGSQTSSNKANNYVSDSQPGGIGGNLAPGSVRLNTKLGA